MMTTKFAFTKLSTIACALLCLTSTQARANVITLTDADAFGLPAAIPSTAEAFIGNGSWQANGVAKTSLYFTPESLGLPGTTTITDIDSIGFSTFKSTTGGSAPDWYLTIYTDPTDNPLGNNGSNWYGLRMTWEGLYANNFSNPADQWNTFNTDAGTNQLTMLDSNTTNFGFYGGPTLDVIKAEDGIIDWSDYPTSSSTETFDYNLTPIQYIVLETGSGWAAGFEGYLDALTVTAGDVSTTVNFDVIPEPSTVLLLGLASIVGIGVRSRKRK